MKREKGVRGLRELTRIKSSACSLWPLAAAKILCVLCVKILLLISCDVNIFLSPEIEPPTETTIEIPEGYGLVKLNLTQGEARTVVPSIEYDDMFLEFEFLDEEGESEILKPASVTGNDYQFLLKTGEYLLEIRIYAIENDSSSLAASGISDVFDVKDGEITDDVYIQLLPYVSGGGFGSVEISLKHPPNVEVEVLSLVLFGGGTPIDLTTVGAFNGTVYTASMGGIPVGYYRLTIQLRDTVTGAVTGGRDIVHIYKDLTARTDPNDPNYEFSADEFRLSIVTNTNNDGPGSLRQAIIDAFAGEAIRIDLPAGSVIAFDAPLEINKNLVINGNGVTLTPSALWPTPGTSTQLIRVTSSGTVKINRVHFKDGRATDFGAAIRNYGYLTLESCIFSGNQTDSSLATGGAIYSSGTLNIMGCTFYNNTSPNYGAVIYNAGILKFTGNIFYQNLSPYNPIIRPGSSCETGGYNIVDFEFGTVTNQAGWVAGTGDTQVSTNPISPSTFKVISGSAAVGIIPSLLPDYPTEDFYGNTINYPAQAGAVQEVDDGSGGTTFIVDNFSDAAGSEDISGTLRYALTNAQDGDTITINSVPGESVIELRTPLAIGTDITIEGNGVTLTPSASWSTSSTTTPLVVTNIDTTIKISRVHFKNGRGNDAGAAISNRGNFTLESCIFSGNKTSNSNAWGGAILNAGNLSVIGCTFYGNDANSSGTSRGGAIYNSGTLNLLGNVFYGNTANEGKAVYIGGGSVTSNGYNVVDVPLGTGTTQAGWTTGTGDIYVLSPTILNTTFKLMPGNEALVKILSRPSGYPVVDFYGESIPASNAAAGAVQSVGVFDINADYIVYNYSDETGSENTPGTLRHALTNADDGDIIAIAGVLPGVSEIVLSTPLPGIRKSINIEGNGITLTPSNTYPSHEESQLISVAEYTATVNISRVHFKDGKAEIEGAAIFNQGNLTLESCIFNNNKLSGSGGSGGAIHNFAGTLVVKGCTFYNNDAALSGGAIYVRQGTLSLAGNLFYGNNAASWKVVYNTGAVTSLGYNFVDVTLGTQGNGNRAGWTNVASDVLFATLPFNSVTGANAFTPINNTTLRSIPSTFASNMPEVDFYGNTRTWPGAPGAITAP